MFDFYWIDPDHADFVRQHALDDLASVLSRRDGRVMQPVHRGRDTVRLSLPDAKGNSQTVFIKREHVCRPKDLARHLLTRRRTWTMARVEFEILQRLAAEGIAAPRPLACAQHGLLPRGCLVLAELAGARSLSSYLAGSLREANRARREEFFTALGCEIARLHETGIDQPDLYASHLYVTPLETGWRISFLDFQKSLLRPRLPLAARARDLAALTATLPRRLADQRDRAALLDGYLAAAELPERGTQLLALVARHAEYLLTQRRIWEIRESDTEEHQAVHPLESVEAGQMWVDRRFRPALEERGLISFEAMMGTTDGRRLRSLADRENWRLELDGPQEGLRGAYLKRHRARTGRAWLRARLGIGPGETAGHVEARNVARLGRAGIAAMRLIAYGEKLHPDGLLESFVMTEELVGYVQLDHFLRARFRARDPRGAAARERELGQLIRDVAAVAAKFHKLGYNHRDLYCCHFFIKEPEAGRFKVNLIDLQRVEHRRRFRRRWIVKDLAQLAYSAPADRIGCRDRMAFIKHYLGVDKLRPQDKRLVRQILAKQLLMERKMGPHP